MARALLLVPPLLKYPAGPLLGPAMLAGAARASGHQAEVLDLAARHILGRLAATRAQSASVLVGDHDRDDNVLRPIQREFSARASQFLPTAPRLRSACDSTLALTFDHAAVSAAARAIARESEGAWILERLRRRERPDVFGVSVLYSGQVLWGLAASILARDLWPGVLVVWGGAHVTALAPEIAADARYGAHIDRFVAGYAEETFVELLNAIDHGSVLPSPCFRAGAGDFVRASERGDVVPVFDDLEPWCGAPRALPAQLSRGCAYGRCAFCTYPSTEGRFRAITDLGAAAVVGVARALGSAVSFKDSLLTPPLLRSAAALCAGTVRWSGCTKLSPALIELMPELASSGCATLELGLETLSEDAQRLIDKRQSVENLMRTLDAAAENRVALVINVITGFPGVGVDEEHWLRWLEEKVATMTPQLVAKIERNAFQLERRAPMATQPQKGLRITGSWPWSSILEWEMAPTAPLKALRRLEVLP